MIDGSVMELVSVGATAGLASATVAAGFGRWVLGQVRETRRDVTERLDTQDARWGEVVAQLSRMNGAVAENTRFRVSHGDAAMVQTATLATLSAQMVALDHRIAEELVPLVNRAMASRI